MGVLYEYTGVVKSVGELLKFDSGFQKRELVLTDDIGQTPQYPNLLFFWFKKERVEKLNGVMPGARVKVTFAIDGRTWEGQGGKEQHYTDLTALKLDVLAGGQVAEPARPVGVTDEPDPDDTPF